MERLDRHQRYMLFATTIAKASATCLRRKFAAIIVDPELNVVISTGYNGSPRETEDCFKRGYCFRNKFNIPSGSNYEKCASIHAEQNAIIHAGLRAKDCVIYISGVDANDNLTDCTPCFMCLKFMINAKISKCYFHNKDGSITIWTTEEMIKHFNEAFEGEDFNYKPYGK